MLIPFTAGPGSGAGRRRSVSPSFLAPAAPIFLSTDLLPSPRPRRSLCQIWILTAAIGAAETAGWSARTATKTGRVPLRLGKFPRPYSHCSVRSGRMGSVNGFFRPAAQRRRPPRSPASETTPVPKMVSGALLVGRTGMGVLPDWMIEQGVKIDPFAPQQHRPGVISYGVTSYGYDVRVDRRFKVFTSVRRCTAGTPASFRRIR